jgi:hypothetical protein
MSQDEKFVSNQLPDDKDGPKEAGGRGRPKDPPQDPPKEDKDRNRPQ